MFLGGN